MSIVHLNKQTLLKWDWWKNLFLVNLLGKYKIPVLQQFFIYIFLICITNYYSANPTSGGQCFVIWPDMKVSAFSMLYLVIISI